MRKAIRKRIRRNGAGVNLAADVNVVIATGEGGEQHTVASSHQRVEQRPATAPEPRKTGEDDKEDR